MLYDVVVDSLEDELIVATVATLGGRLVADPEREGEPYLTRDGYLVVRVRLEDPLPFVRELERRVSLRVVGIYARLPAGG